MLRGIDISSYQTGIDLKRALASLDFCIVKCTEGLAFVDTPFKGWCDEILSLGKLLGFYHFARANDAGKEAEYFYKACKPYIGKGVPVLDTETGQSGMWCQTFVSRFHELSGVWPVLYMSSNSTQRERFADTLVPNKCGLWEAFYPKSGVTSFEQMPDYEGGTYPWAFGAMWQFTSSGKVSGFNGNVDLDIAWMDAAGWQAYARSAPQEAIDGQPTIIYEDESIRIYLEHKQ